MVVTGVGYQSSEIEKNRDANDNEPFNRSRFYDDSLKFLLAFGTGIVDGHLTVVAGEIVRAGHVRRERGIAKSTIAIATR